MEQNAAEWQHAGSSAVGEEAEIADTGKAPWQHMLYEPAQELFGGKCEGALPAVVGVVLLAPQLEQGKLDFGLVIEDAVKNPHLQVETLCSEPVTLLVHPQHPLVARTFIEAEDLREEAFLLTDAGCAYRSKLEQAMGETHVKPKTVMEFSSVETIKQCAALGMGIACLPTIVAETELATRKLAALPWSGPDLTMRTLVAWHKDKWLSPAMEAFLALLRDSLKTKAQVRSRKRVNGRSLPV